MSKEEKDKVQALGREDFISFAWSRKWSVLLLFLAPVVLSIVVTLFMPTSYNTETIVQIKSLPEIDEESIDYISQKEVRIMVGSSELLGGAIKALEPKYRDEFSGKNDQEVVHWVKDNLETEATESEDTLELTLGGPTEPETLKAVLDNIVGRLKIRTRDLFSGRKEKKLNILQVKLDTLEDEIDSLRNNADDLKDISIREPTLKAGEQDGSLRGLILKSEFKSIRDQMGELQGKRDKAKIKKRSLTKIAPTDFQPLRVLSKPYVPEVPAGPDWKLNLALGVLAGLLFALFGVSFVRYLGIQN